MLPSAVVDVGGACDRPPSGDERWTRETGERLRPRRLVMMLGEGERRWLEETVETSFMRKAGWTGSAMVSFDGAMREWTANDDCDNAIQLYQ